jgi:hypothetical protein
MPVNDRPDPISEFGRNNVDADDFAVLAPQRANQRFAQVTTATCN